MIPKIRAWDKKKKTMYNARQIDFRGEEFCSSEMRGLNLTMLFSCKPQGSRTRMERRYTRGIYCVMEASR